MADKESLKKILLGGQRPVIPEPVLALEIADDDVISDEPRSIGPCASRITTKWWPGFHVKNAKLIPGNKPTTRSCDYSHMGYREFDPSGTFFIIEINEPEKWRIRVEGRALWQLYNYLHQHRLEWIEAAKGNAAMGVPEGIPVIERITIERIEDAEE